MQLPNNSDKQNNQDNKTIIIYASHDGHTQKISETLRDKLGNYVDLLNVSDCNVETVANYDCLIFGAPIRYGKHLPVMVDYLKTHREALLDKKTAFFSVNLTARKPHRSTAETSNYPKKLFLQLDWKPNLVDVFAGKIDYPSYCFFDKLMIRFIMWLTKGPTAPDTVKEFTDWQRIDDFAVRLSDLLKT